MIVPTEAKPTDYVGHKQITEPSKLTEIKPSEPLKVKKASYNPPKKKTAPRPSSVAPTGNCDSWIRQAGITDIQTAKLLIGGESGCNPRAVNPSSGAFGIPQALPASKIAHCGVEPVCQLRWMDGYIKSVYGSWGNAYSTWQSRSPHWY